MYRLLAICGDEEQFFAIPDSEVTLGSAPENGLVLRIRGVSRKHAVVKPVSNGVEILDLGSKNGLLLGGQRTIRAILKPGISIQVGAAWLTVEEISASEETLSLTAQGSLGKLNFPPFTTSTLESGGELTSRSPADSALALGVRIVQAGVGIPGERDDILTRIMVTLGAEAFGTFERTRRGTLRNWECVGEFSAEDTRLLSSLTTGAQSFGYDQLILKRHGRLLLSGWDTWFLGARFADESLAREGWRKDFHRLLASQFFKPVRSLEDLTSAEASRVLALAKGNKKRAAELLGVSRGTLYSLLARHSAPKS